MRPALTAEWWEDVHDEDMRPGLLYEVCYLWGAERPHAVAAIALEGQPFGFTREDVKELRGVAEDYEHRGLTPCPFDTLNDLADRIEALLPPEGV